MSDGTDFDDSDPGIVYSGSWLAETGTISQQFDNTVHQTTTNGASATIKFTGTRITVFQTVPGGDGAPETVNINFDGDTSTMSRITRPGQAFYQDRWFDSGPLTNGVHILVLTNAGGDGGTPLILDRFNIEGTLTGSGVAAHLGPTTTTTTPTLAPVPSPQPSPSTNSGIPSTTSSNSNTPSATTTSQGSESVPSSSTTTPMSGTQSLSLASNSKFGFTTSSLTSSTHTVVSVQYVTDANGSVSTIFPSPSTSSNAINNADGLPIRLILGLAIGFSVAILLFILLLFCLVRLRRKRAQLEDTESKKVERRSPTDVSPFNLSRQGGSGSPISDVHDPSLGIGWLGRKARNETSTTTRRDSVPTATSTPSSNRGQSEKSAELFSGVDEPVTTTALAPSSDTANRIPEADAGPFRPNYLAADTILYGPGGGVYALITSPNDSTTGPPPYQSASQRNSAA